MYSDVFITVMPLNHCEDLTTFLMSTWWGDSKNMEEIEFSRWLFEGRPRQGKNVLPDWLNWLCYLAGSSKSRHENSISFILLESPHQEDMKNVVKYSKHFFGYFNSQETHSDVRALGASVPWDYLELEPILQTNKQLVAYLLFVFSFYPGTSTLMIFYWNERKPISSWRMNYFCTKNGVTNLTRDAFLMVCKKCSKNILKSKEITRLNSF